MSTVAPRSTTLRGPLSTSVIASNNRTAPGRPRRASALSSWISWLSSSLSGPTASSNGAAPAGRAVNQLDGTKPRGLRDRRVGVRHEDVGAEAKSVAGVRRPAIGGGAVLVRRGVERAAPTSAASSHTACAPSGGVARSTGAGRRAARSDRWSRSAEPARLPQPGQRAIEGSGTEPDSTAAHPDRRTASSAAPRLTPTASSAWKAAEVSGGSGLSRPARSAYGHSGWCLDSGLPANGGVVISRVSKVIVPVAAGRAGALRSCARWGSRLSATTAMAASDRWSDVLSPREAEQGRGARAGPTAAAPTCSSNAPTSRQGARTHGTGRELRPAARSSARFGWWALLDNEGTRYALGQWEGASTA